MLFTVVVLLIGTGLLFLSSALLPPASSFCIVCTGIPEESVKTFLAYLFFSLPVVLP
jgi:hypothetical protein